MTYYDVLGISPNASDEEIKRAYRAQIKFFHPDVFTENPEIARIKTLQLNEAYAVLKDPIKRHFYDLTIAPPPPQRPSPPPPPPPPSYDHNSPGFRHEPPSYNSPPPCKKNKFTKPERIMMVLCVVFVIVVFIPILGEMSVPSSPASLPASSSAVYSSSGSPFFVSPSPSFIVNPPPTPTPIHINIKSGTVLHDPIEDAVAPLTVETPYGQNYYICLKSLSGNTDSEMSFYIKGGETEKVYVPLGRYHIYYATGDLWFGTKSLFGEDTFCYRCDDVFDFYIEDDYYIGWTLTLSQTYNGNLSSEDVPLDDFPAVG